MSHHKNLRRINAVYKQVYKQQGHAVVKTCSKKILIEVNPATSVDRESTRFRKIMDGVSMRRCDGIFSELSESRTKKDGGKDCHVSTVWKISSAV